MPNEQDTGEENRIEGRERAVEVGGTQAAGGGVQGQQGGMGRGERVMQGVGRGGPQV